MNHSIDLAKLLSITGDDVVGHTVKYVDSTSSTMAMAKSYLESTSQRRTAISGTIFIAEEQTEGRGRRSRNWKAPHGKALLVSTIIQQPYLPQNPASLAMVAGLAAARAIEKFSGAPADHVRLKWPNDLLLPISADLERTPHETTLEMGKVGGVLIESAFQGDMLQYAILGIGINVNQTENELPPPPFGAPKPTSIRLYLGKVINRTALLAALCKELSKELSGILMEHKRSGNESALQNKQDDALYQAWRSRLDTLNKQVSIYEHVSMSTHVHNHETSATGASIPMPLVSGKAVDVTSNGDLIIEDSQGDRQCYSAGDVSVR